MKKFTMLTVLLLILSSNSYAYSLLGRLGMGMTNQVATDVTQLSLKVQKTKTMALGLLLGIKSDTDDTNYAIGGKIYKLIYDEPQLNFYTALLIAVFNTTEESETKSRFQLDASFGAEFALRGLESMGLSFEFGMSINNKGGNTSFQTVGDHVMQAAIHFYL
jgi:hypothetical protein